MKERSHSGRMTSEILGGAKNSRRKVNKSYSMDEELIYSHTTSIAKFVYSNSVKQELRSNLVQKQTETSIDEAECAAVCEESDSTLWQHHPANNKTHYCNVKQTVLLYTSFQHLFQNPPVYSHTIYLRAKNGDVNHNVRQAGMRDICHMKNLGQ